MKIYAVWLTVIIFVFGVLVYVNNIINRQIDNVVKYKAAPSAGIVEKSANGTLAAPPQGLVYMAPPQEYKKVAKEEKAQPQEKMAAEKKQIIYEIPLEGGVMLQ